MPDPSSHAQMIAAINQRIEYLDDVVPYYELAAGERDAMHAIRDYLERTQWRLRSEIADTTLGLDTEVLGFQPDIGNEAEDEIPSRYGVTTAGHLASGGWEQCTHYQPLFPPSPERPR